MKISSLLSPFLLAMLCNGCVNHISEEEEEIESINQKTIVFRTAMNVSQVPMRSISEDVSKIVVADYQEGKEIQKIEQKLVDANFGQISIPLKYGTHELLFVGHNSENGILSYPAISFDKLMDTFSFYLSLEVNQETPSSKIITLERSVGLLKIVAKDAIPSAVKSLSISLSAYYPSLNIKTSIANGSPQAFERTFEYKTSNIGAKESTYSIYTFVPDAGFTSNIVISSIGANDEIVNSITLEDVPIEKNKQTIISGNLFQLDSDINLSVNNQWGENIEIPI